MLLNHHCYYYYINWRRVALQCCVGFCCTTMQIIHQCIYICIYPLCFEPPSHPPPFHPSRSSQSTALGSLCIQQLFTSYIYFIHCDVYMSVLLVQFIPPSFSLTVSTRLSTMSVSLFLSYLYVHQYSFSRPHIYALTMFVFLSSLCITGLASSTSF